MKTRKTLCLTAAVIVVTVALFVTGLVYYHDSYDSATRIGEWRRLPLSYPWHAVDYGCESSGVQLDDWQVYAGEKYVKKSIHVPIGSDDEKETLQTLKYIGRFAYCDGYLYGVRDVYCPSGPNGDVSAPKWFILKYGHEKPSYFDTEDEYQKNCWSLNINPHSIRSFSDHWEDYHKKIFQKSLWVQMLSGWRILVKNL